MLQIREAQPEDSPFLQELYLHHLTARPEQAPPERWEALFAQIREDPNYHLLVALADGRPVCSVTLVIIPNLTHGCRPYALVENVVTHADYRRRGFAGALMKHAAALARAAGYYKIMLLTGSKRPETLHFYESCGFNRQEKTGFILRP